MTPAAPQFSNAAPSSAPIKKVRGQTARDRARAEGRLRKAQEQAGRTATAEPAPTAPIAPPIPLTRKGRERDLLDGKAEYKLVPIEDLLRDPDQPRKVFKNIAALADNIRRLGLEQPITARIDAKNQLIIMMGERRFRAIQQLSRNSDPEVAAKWKFVPTIIRYGVPDSDILAHQLAENSHRDEMDPIDEARGIRRYMSLNKIATYMEAAQKLGHSLSWVTNRIALLDLDGEDQDRVSSGELSILHGVTKARQKSGKAYKTSKGGIVRVPPHFSDDHFLAGRARSRCNAALKAGESHGSRIGGVACGSCWEVVIRLDARRNPDALTGDK